MKVRSKIKNVNAVGTLKDVSPCFIAVFRSYAIDGADCDVIGLLLGCLLCG